MVEFSLVILPLMLMVMGVLDAGRMLWTYSTVSQAVTIAARCAAVDPQGQDASYPTLCPDYVSFAKNASYGIDANTINYTVSNPQCGYVKVTATYTFQPTLAPFNLSQQVESATFSQQQDQNC